MACEARRSSSGLQSFSDDTVRVERAWKSHPAHELDSVRNRAWSALRHLDEEYERTAGPGILALKALPQGSLR